MSRILVLGDLNLDIHVHQGAATPPPGYEVRERIDITPGGSAGTFARQAAASGSRVLFVGAVGNDLMGDLLERSLEDAGVRTRLRHVEGIPTGAVLALPQGMERSMVCSRGANDGLTEDWIGESLLEDVEHVHLSGYMLLSPHQLGAARRVIKLAASASLSVSVDPPPANLIAAFGVPAFSELLPRGCWLFPNPSEGALLTGRRSPETIVENLATRHPVGALTLGERGAIAWDPEGRLAQSVDAMDCANTTGAGDAFAGAFVASYLESRNLKRAAQAGTDASTKLLGSRTSAG